MTILDPSKATCTVFTYKEGLLSLLAHDLKLRVTGFSIAIDEKNRSVDARFDAWSLRTACAMKNGSESPGALKQNDHLDVERNIVKDVLRPSEFPELRFRSSSVEKVRGAYLVSGHLTLCGQTRNISTRIDLKADHWLVEYSLHQPDWGIKPFSALLGAMKIKPDITVRLSVPVDQTSSNG